MDEKPAPSASWLSLPIYLRLAIGVLLAVPSLALTISGIVADLAGRWELVTPIALGVLFIGAALLAGDIGEYVQHRRRSTPER